MNSYKEYTTEKVDWYLPLQRTNGFPLDRTDLFSSYEDAVKYAKGDASDSRKLGKTSYIGQIITVFENNEVMVFKINHDRTLEPLHGKTLSKDEYNALKQAGKLIDGMIYYTYEQ